MDSSCIIGLRWGLHCEMRGAEKAVFRCYSRCLYKSVDVLAYFFFLFTTTNIILFDLVRPSQDTLDFPRFLHSDHKPRPLLLCSPTPHTINIPFPHLTSPHLPQSHLTQPNTIQNNLTNPTTTMHITPTSSLSIAKLIIFTPLLLSSIYLLLKHGLARSSGWLQLSIVCLIRVMGSAASIVTITNPKDVTAYVMADVLLVIGIAPILGSMMGLLSRA